jgi:hypothetical protein
VIVSGASLPLEEGPAHGEALLRPVGQGLDTDGATQPVEAAHLPDHEPLSGGHGRRLSRFPGRRTRRRERT